MWRILSRKHRRFLMALGAAVTLTIPFRSAFAGSAQPLPPVIQADGRLGLCDVLPGNAPDGASWAQLAYNAGARINRWEFRWDRIEPRNGQWDFSADDAAVASSLHAGLAVEGILIGTPGWAAGSHQPPGNGVPRGLDRPAGDPANTWAAYVRGTVLHYRGQVHAWEVWNEPDISYFWHGNADQYFQLLRTAYVVIKTLDPSATVLMGGMVVPDFAFAQRVLQDAERAPDADLYDGYFDAVAWHAYGNARLLYSNIVRFRALVASDGFGRVPLWVTEDGFPSSNPNGEPRQAAYVLQTIAYAFAAGAAKVIVYRASDDTSTKTWGLLTAQGVPRMGYVGFQVAARYFSHLSAVTYAPDPGVERFALYRPNQRLTLLWGTGLTNRPLSLPSAAGSASLVDWQGGASGVAATDGQLRLTLPGASYNQGVDPKSQVVAGPPVLVMEDNTRPSGLISESYVRGLPGSRRRLALLNQGASRLSVLITPLNRRAAREVVQLPPRSLQTIDLDLLAGPAYTGAFQVQATAPLTLQADSSQAVAPSTVPSATWFSSVPTPSVTIANPSPRPVSVNATGYAMNGHRLLRASFRLPAGSVRSASIAARGMRSFELRAAGPVVLPSSPAVAQPQTTWYAIHPRAPRLSLFNPGAGTAHVDIHFLGAPTVTGQQLKLSPRHSFIIRTHGARAVVLSSTRGLAVAPGASQGQAPLVSHASTDAALAAGGPITHVALLNPGTVPAHVTYSVVNRLQSSQHSVVIGPGHVASVAARARGDAPRGVIVHSDVAVVAAPAP